MPNCLKVLVLAQYFSPEMDGGSTRIAYIINGGCQTRGVAKFVAIGTHGRACYDRRTGMLKIEAQ